MPLTDSTVRAIKAKDKPQKVSDGGGLFIYVTKASKLWRMAYRYEGKQKLLSFGPYPSVSLATARAERDKAKQLLKAGHDPIKHKGASIDAGAFGFEFIAREWWSKNDVTWAESHKHRKWRELQRDAFPDLGKTHIRDISARDILKVLRKIEERGALDTVKHVRESIGQIFRFAIAEGKVERNPVPDLKGALKPRPPRKPQAAVAISELPDLLKRLHSYRGNRTTALGLEIALHTAVRTGEIRLAMWPEIDWKARLWTIPASHMKTKLEHTIPLTDHVLDLLRQLKAEAGNFPYLLPGRGGQVPVSANTLLFGIYRMGLQGEQTVHGFRSLFSTWANEGAEARPDVIEACLAHTPQDKVRAAYNRAAYMAERRALMEKWSGYLREQDPNDLAGLLD